MPPVDDRARAFARSLGPEERVLVLLRDELYGRRWEALLEDLHAVRERRPSVIRLRTRIDEDLARIAKLRAFEEKHAVDLGELLGNEPGARVEDAAGQEEAR